MSPQGQVQSAPHAAPPGQLAHPGGSHSSFSPTMPSPHVVAPGLPPRRQPLRQVATTLRQSVLPAAYMIRAAAMHARLPVPVHPARCAWNATKNGRRHALPTVAHPILQELPARAGEAGSATAAQSARQMAAARLTRATTRIAEVEELWLSFGMMQSPREQRAIPRRW